MNLNADAEWAIERWEALDPARSQWDEDTATAALRRYLIALGWPEPRFIDVATSPSAAVELVKAGCCSSADYCDLTRSHLRAELDSAPGPSKQAFRAGIDRVARHPTFEALSAIADSWLQKASPDVLLPALFEVAAAIGCRAAELSPDLVWMWDQALIAYEAGVGWFAPIDDGLVVLPRPHLTMPAGRLHRIDGPAVQWPGGANLHFLEGVEFDQDLYRKVVNRTITAEEALSCEVDQQFLAMSAAPPNDLLARMDAKLVDTGVKGTLLYRVDRHFGLDRPDYCITMNDPSTDKCYLEWVEPDVGEQRDAELCQAHLFGISVDEWLSLRAEA